MQGVRLNIFVKIQLVKLKLEIYAGGELVPPNYLWFMAPTN